MSAKEKIDTSGLEDAIQDILSEYSEDVVKGVNAAVKKTAQDMAKEIKANSPAHTGKYRSGWTTKQTRKCDTIQSDQYTVYNKSRPGLAHLLENGHKMVAGGKVIGTSPAHTHIAPAVDAAEKNFEQTLRKELKA